MAQGHPIAARVDGALHASCWSFFAAVFALTVGNGGKLGSVMALGGKIGLVEVKGTSARARTSSSPRRPSRRAPPSSAVVVRIESPGGGVAPSQEIYDAIRQLREEEAGDRVARRRRGLGRLLHRERLRHDRRQPRHAHRLDRRHHGARQRSRGSCRRSASTPDILKAGSYKDMGSLVRPMTDAERALFQEMIDSVHTQFITAVAAGRSMDKDQVRAVADGRIFSGEQAKVAGLVDVLGGLEDAIDLAAERGGIEGEPRVTHARSSREPWWLRLLFSFAPTGPFSSTGPSGSSSCTTGRFCAEVEEEA